MNEYQQADDECECQFEYSVEHWVPLGGTPPPHSSLCILNIWHERKGTGWGRLRLRLRFYTPPPLSATTPSRPEYRKGCLCCGIPMHSERERKRGGRGGVSSRGRVRQADCTQTWSMNESVWMGRLSLVFYPRQWVQKALLHWQLFYYLYTIILMEFQLETTRKNP